MITQKKHRFSVAAGIGAVVVAAACTGGALYGASHPATAGAQVPGEFTQAVTDGGEQCSAVDGPLLAGVLDTSSGFDTTTTSDAGAQGPAQLLPATWAAVGTNVDASGTVTGAPGDGDPRDPADATMTLARVLCQVAADQDTRIAAGELHGDRTELMLAGFLAGEDTVTKHRGVPQIADVPEQIGAIRAAAQSYGQE